MVKIKDSHILIVFCSLFFISALSLALCQPSDPNHTLLNPPDETSRFLVPLYIYNHGTLPSGLEEEIRIPGFGFSYGLSNIFPYILQAMAMRATSLVTTAPPALLYSARFVNVLFGLLTAITLFAASKHLFAKRNTRWLFCFAVMFLPQHLFLFSYCNTEACSFFSISLILLAIARAKKDSFTLGTTIILSLGIALCALSYYNAYGWILGSLFMFLCHWVTTKESNRLHYNFKSMLQRTGIIFAITVVGCGWWFIHQYIMLDGDFLGLSTRKALLAIYGDPEVQLTNTFHARNISIFHMIFSTGFIPSVVGSFIANYGSMAIHAPIIVYPLFLLMWGSSLLYLIKKETLTLLQKDKVFYSTLLICLITPIVLQIIYCHDFDYQPQGRYLLPGLVPFTILFAKGTEKLSLKFKVLKFLPETESLVILSCCIIHVFVRAIPLYLA